MYYYKMYGLVVKSEFEMPEGRPLKETPDYDVSIELGLPPVQERMEAQNGRICKMEPSIAWFCLPDMGMFYVEGGRRIVVWKITDKLTDLSRNSYVTGTTFGLLMFQRGIVPIHSGAVSWKGKCALIVGESGAGKSTNCVLLKEKGCKFVTDDVAAVTVEQGIVMANPAFPQQKLCRDAALRQGYNLDDLIYIDEYRDKYAVRLQEQYEEEAVPIGLMVELLVTEEEQLRIEEVTGIEKAAMVFHNIYRREVWQEMGAGKTAQDILLKLAQQVPMFRIYRPQKGIYNEEITNWIMNYM